MDLGAGEVVVMHSPTAVVHFCQAASPDEWGNIPVSGIHFILPTVSGKSNLIVIYSKENQLRPRVVKRGVSEFEIGRAHV